MTALISKPSFKTYTNFNNFVSIATLKKIFKLKKKALFKYADLAGFSSNGSIVNDSQPMIW